MATFEVLVRPILSVEDHPNADRLSICKVDGYNCISAKLEDGSHRYQAGESICYIPEGAVLPEWLLRRLDMWNEAEGKGFLNGPNGDRVKAIKLRGILSQGVMFPAKELTVKAQVGDNVAHVLGIIKYEPPVPTSMSGEVIGIREAMFKFDVENIKKYPNVLRDGENVVVTEKLHGTCSTFGFIKDLKHGNLRYSEKLGGSFVAGSKGLMSQGLVFKHTEGNYAKNLYLRMENQYGIFDKIEKELIRLNDFIGLIPTRFYLFGEIFGQGVQDLSYGFKNPEFRAFEVFFDDGKNASYVDDADKDMFLSRMDIGRVPVLYRGPFDRAKIDELATGKSTFAKNQIREGIVITPTAERIDNSVGRVILKNVSEAYLTRKNATEYS